MRTWCLFRSGRELFAVALGTVAEVVEVDRLEKLPHAPPAVIGLCVLRREVIPVVALDDSALEAAADSEARPSLLILKTSHATWGVRIDRAGTTVAESALDPEAPAGRAPWGAWLGTVRHAGESHAAIDPEAAWRHLRQCANAWYSSPPGRDDEDRGSPSTRN
jgi:purine-binding chemotaxis protein CheW